MNAAAERLIDLAAQPASTHDPVLPAQFVRGRWIGEIERLLSESFDSASCEDALRFIMDSFDRVHPGQMLWQVGLGQLARSDVPLPARVSQIAFLLSSLGARGDWSIECEAPHWAYFDVNAVRVSGRISARVEEDRLHLRASNGKTSESVFRRDGSLWLPDDAPGLSSRVGAAHAAILTPDDLAADGELMETRSAPDAPREALGDLVLRALKLLDEHSPELLPWMASVWKGVLFVETVDESTSASSSTHLGMITVTYPMPPEQLATLLVHECAHQYVFLLGGERALVRPDSTGAFYSPFKGTYRPLYYVILALHAAVNMRRFTVPALCNGFYSDFLLKEDEKLENDIETMSGQIAGSTELTPWGERFISRLRP